MSLLGIERAWQTSYGKLVPKILVHWIIDNLQSRLVLSNNKLVMSIPKISFAFEKIM